MSESQHVSDHHALLWLSGAYSPQVTAETVWYRPKAPGEVVAYGGSPGCPGSEPDGYVPSRSVAPLTRLETRTKESNMYASHWVD